MQFKSDKIGIYNTELRKNDDRGKTEGRQREDRMTIGYEYVTPNTVKS